MKKKKVLLSIAGYDPTAGAGIFLDIQTFMDLGFHGTGIVTALTAQNTNEVRDKFCPPPNFLLKQYQALRDDIPISGIKVGMLGCYHNILEVAQILSKHPEIPIVVDPILKSSSGFWLLEKEDISVYTEMVGSKASLLTPNIYEATVLSGMDIHNIGDMKKAAERIFHVCKTPCLVKGGHLKDSPVDALFDGKSHFLYKKEKIQKSVHGTGCLLSSSILGYLVQGHSIKYACALGIQLTTEAIKNAIPVGHGQYIFQFS
jgi:hydroxymethylpyrimidine/phosphomethylpyrimidine kinase